MHIKAFGKQVLFLCGIIFLISTHAQHTHAGNKSPSHGLYGTLGLNTTPSARHDETGNTALHLSTSDPYIHASLSTQITSGLNIALRQSAEISGLNDSPDRFYPGVDLKLRLLQEDRYIPAVSVGLQSAFGHKRFASEYLAASKHYGNFDFSAGIAWGRLGSAAHIDNPLKILGSHFHKKRALSGESPNTAEHWFTGKDVGFFGGIEYFVPPYKKLEGLSFKADWGADRYIVEQQNIDGYDAPDPWAIGVHYKPADWINGGVSVLGGEKMMGTLTLQSPLSHWRGKTAKKRTPARMRPYRTGLSLPREMEVAASSDGIALYDTKRRPHDVRASLYINQHDSLPKQIGRTARHISNHAGKTVEAITLQPRYLGLRGPHIKFMRRDLENAIARHHGSPQEIWRNTAFHKTAPPKQLLEDRRTFSAQWFTLSLNEDISLSEEDSGILHRTSAVLSNTKQLSDRFHITNGFRLNITDNLHKIHDLRPRNPLPTRGDIDRFADSFASLDHSYIGWTQSLGNEVHAALVGGYLEEMYAGFGGEILYRPFGKTFGIGAEAYQVMKRDPYSFADLSMTGDGLVIGALNGWYEFPGTDMTLHARAGRYLAEDIGGTLSLQNRFKNGTSIEAFITATDDADFDSFGGTTHLYTGLALTLPIGNVPYIPEGSRANINMHQIGRNSGQYLDKPFTLYDATEKMSYRHITTYWNKIKN